MQINYTEIIGGLAATVDKKELLAKVKLKSYNDEDFFDFLDFLIQQELVISIDWSGEDNPGDIFRFLKNRLDCFNVSLNIDDDAIQSKLLLGVEKESIIRGEAVPFLIKHYQKAVSKLGFVIFDIYTGQDMYYIGICKKRTLTKLKKIKIPNNHCFLKFGGTRNKEVLYAIDCERCGMSSVWQKKVEDFPPTEGFCDKCGINLFDKFGKPIYMMEKIPVP